MTGENTWTKYNLCELRYPCLSKLTQIAELPWILNSERQQIMDTWLLNFAVIVWYDASWINGSRDRSPLENTQSKFSATSIAYFKWIPNECTYINARRVTNFRYLNHWLMDSRILLPVLDLRATLEAVKIPMCQTQNVLKLNRKRYNCRS